MSQPSVVMDHESAFIAGVTSTAFVWFILAPISIYQTYKFWNNRNFDYIKKRHPKLVVFTIIGLMIYAMFCRPYGYYVDIYYDIPDISNAPFIFSKQYSVIIVWSILLIVLILNVRLFSTYYDFERNKQILSLKWKSQITDNRNTNLSIQTNIKQIAWTIKYQRVFGNVELLTILNIAWFVIAETFILLTVENNKLYQITKACFGLSGFIISIILLILAMRLKDTLGIHQEIISITIIGFIVGILWVIPSTLLNEKSLIRELNSLIVLQFGAMLISIRMATPISFNQIPWYKYCMFIIFKNHNFKRKPPSLRAVHSHTDIHIDQDDDDDDDGDMDGDGTTICSSSKLDSILIDFDGFEYFADYLVRELCVEYILYLLEWKQLQIDLINNNLIDIDTDGWNLKINKKIIDNICCEHNGIDQCYNYMMYIFNRYIANHAISQINVSWSTQINIKKLLNSFNRNTKELDSDIIGQLYMEYESCAQILYTNLIKHSLERFMQTKEYKNWKNLTYPQL